MGNVEIFTLVSLIYLFSSLCYFSCLFFPKESFRKAATLITSAGLFAHTLGYIVRWVESYRLGVGHTPFAFFTLYETLVFTCWSFVIIHLIIEYKYKIRSFGALILPLVAAGMLYASLSPGVSGEIQALPSVLQGNLFIHHAIGHFVAYCFFGTSFLVSMVILIMETPLKAIIPFKKVLHRFPPAKNLDNLSYKAIAIGFIFYSFGMATGVYRTKIIWGSYWSADPSEISALIQWLLYALILHGRYQKWCGVKGTSLLSIAAFVTAVCTFFISMGYMMMTAHYPF
jgi:ABC-type transport system involved in cytochrome c biogenesis permease subunit